MLWRRISFSLFHGVSFAVLGWWWGEKVLILQTLRLHFTNKLYSRDGNKNCTKLRLNFNHFSTLFKRSTNSLLFDLQELNFQFQNTQFSSFSLHRAIIVIITCFVCATSQFKLQEQKKFLLLSEIDFGFNCVVGNLSWKSFWWKFELVLNW